MIKMKTIWDGLNRRCPQCAIGKTMVGYLKQQPSCAHCGADFTDITPDDAPAWATIFISGHFVTTIMVYIVRGDFFPLWGEMLALVVVAMPFILFFLPIMKGMFINIIWYTKNQSS